MGDWFCGRTVSTTTMEQASTLQIAMLAIARAIFTTIRIVREFSSWLAPLNASLMGTTTTPSHAIIINPAWVGYQRQGILNNMCRAA